MAAGQTARRKAKHPYITRKKDTCGGKPIIAGTRIKVEQIVINYEHMGQTPDQIAEAHPHLTLAQIHDALSYYYDHATEIQRDIRAGNEFAQALQQLYSGSVLKQKLKRQKKKRRRGQTTNLHK